MKTITPNTQILSILFIFLSGNLFAVNDGAPTTSDKAINSFYAILAPSTPKETNFNDNVMADYFSALVPVTPKNATFDDENEQVDLLILNILAPVTPKEAGFDDEANQTNDLKALTPVTPSQADFE